MKKTTKIRRYGKQHHTKHARGRLFVDMSPFPVHTTDEVQKLMAEMDLKEKVAESPVCARDEARKTRSKKDLSKNEQAQAGPVHATGEVQKATIKKDLPEREQVQECPVHATDQVPNPRSKKDGSEKEQAQEGAVDSTDEAVKMMAEVHLKEQALESLVHTAAKDEADEAHKTTVKVDTVKMDTVKVDTIKVDKVKVDTVKVDTVKVDTQDQAPEAPAAVPMPMPMPGKRWTAAKSRQSKGTRTTAATATTGPKDRPATPRPSPSRSPSCSRSPAAASPSPEASPRCPDVSALGTDTLRVLTWPEICPPGATIAKIAEASYAEVYRISNEKGTSIIKVIRMESRIRPQTRAQQRAGLVDEAPHCEADLVGELRISESLFEIPGFVVYKERYIAQGAACPALLQTHRAFQARLKKQDPDRLQFYPSPSRYLAETKFLIVELGDAGIALEDFELVSADQLWDIFFHVAIALGRAEVEKKFEHRDLHEGNVCIRQTGDTLPSGGSGSAAAAYFGRSGLEITILDYGLSRAMDSSGSGSGSGSGSVPIAYDLERDLSLFTSEHAPQCRVYRQMRSFLLRGDRVCLPAEEHKTPYQKGKDGPISWAVHETYTNVLWLAYLYDYMLLNFKGPKKEVTAFKRETRSLWKHLNPDAAAHVPRFNSARDIVGVAVDNGWVHQEQLRESRDEVEKSIVSAFPGDDLATTAFTHAHVEEQSVDGSGGTGDDLATAFVDLQVQEQSEKRSRGKKTRKM